MQFSQEYRDRLTYAFNHLVSSNRPEDPHHADSGELGREVLEEVGLLPHEIEVVLVLTEHVAGNYEYTGEAAEYRRKIESGEV